MVSYQKMFSQHAMAKRMINSEFETGAEASERCTKVCPKREARIEILSNLGQVTLYED